MHFISILLYTRPGLADRLKCFPVLAGHVAELEKRGNKRSTKQYGETTLFFALALYAKSRAAYRLLRNAGFALPSHSTLVKAQRSYRVQPGIDTARIGRYVKELLEPRLDELKAKYPGQPDEELLDLLRTGYLSFDECQLAPEPSYHSKSGEMSGLVLYGDGTRLLECPSVDEPELASHSLVLMFSSCCTEVSFPVAQFHTRSLTAEQLLAILRQLVCALIDVCGLDLVNLNADGYVSCAF